MPVPILVLLILLGLYLLFIVVPTVILTLLTFRRKDREELLARDFRGSYYEPYVPQFKEAAGRLQALNPEEVRIQAKDGIPLYGRYFDRKAAVTAVLFHGFHATAERNCGLQALYFYEQGYNVLLVDMRAHGESGGRFTSFGLLEQEDVLLWCDEARKMPGVEALIVYGVSMGASSLGFASDRFPAEVRAMVFDCGYTSPKDAFLPILKRKHLPYFLMMPVMRLMIRLMLSVDMYEDARETLKKAKTPALFIRGEIDTTVDPALVKAAYEACGAEKELLTVPGAEHTLSFLVDGDSVKAAIGRLLEKGFK